MKTEEIIDKNKEKTSDVFCKSIVAETEQPNKRSISIIKLYELIIIAGYILMAIYAFVDNIIIAVLAYISLIIFPLLRIIKKYGSSENYNTNKLFLAYALNCHFLLNVTMCTVIAIYIEQGLDIGLIETARNIATFPIEYIIIQLPLNMFIFAINYLILKLKKAKKKDH